MNASESSRLRAAGAWRHLPGAVTADEALNPTLALSVEHLVATCQALRESPGLEFVAFSDVTAADFHPRRTPRFDVVYHLVSPHRRARVRLKVQVHTDEPVPTVSTIWQGAGCPNARSSTCSASSSKAMPTYDG